MGRAVEVFVVLPGGVPASGVRLLAHNNNAADNRVADWRGTTRADGRHRWNSLDTGLAGDHYHFTARYIDDSGVEWIFALSDRIFAPPPNGPQVLEIRMELTPAYVEELALPELPSEVKQRLGQDPDGRAILDRFNELARAIVARITIGTITLSTSIIEGLLKVSATRRGVWRQEWEADTFGALIRRQEIQAMMPAGLVHRLQGLNQFRTPAAHYLGGNPAPAEASLAAQLAREVAVACFV